MRVSYTKTSDPTVINRRVDIGTTQYRQVAIGFALEAVYRKFTEASKKGLK